MYGACVESDADAIRRMFPVRRRPSPPAHSVTPRALSHPPRTQSTPRTQFTPGRPLSPPPAVSPTPRTRSTPAQSVGGSRAPRRGPVTPHRAPSPRQIRDAPHGRRACDAAVGLGRRARLWSFSRGSPAFGLAGPEGWPRQHRHKVAAAYLLAPAQTQARAHWRSRAPGCDPYPRVLEPEKTKLHL